MEPNNDFSRTTVIEPTFVQESRYVVPEKRIKINLIFSYLLVILKSRSKNRWNIMKIKINVRKGMEKFCNPW